MTLGNNALDIRQAQEPAGDPPSFVKDHQPESEPLRPERLAPHDEGSEQSLIGSVLLNEAILPSLTSYVSTDDFLFRRNALLWGVLVMLYRRGDHIDDLTLIGELERLRILESVGGAAYITKLIANTPTYIHAETYARIVNRAAVRRRLIAAAAEIAQSAQDEGTEVNEISDNAIRLVHNASHVSETKPVLSGAQYASLVLQEAIDRKNGVAPAVITTGLGIDDLLTGGGFEGGQLIIVGARPGDGKSTIAATVAYHAALNNKHAWPFSNEMGGKDITRRILSAITHIPYMKIKRGAMDDEQWQRLTNAIADTDGVLSRIRIPSPGDNINTTSAIAAACRKEKARGKLDIVIVDYLGLLEPTAEQRDAGNRAIQVGMMTRELKLLALELDVPVLVCAQDNRESEKRADKRPQLADLKESGSIEADADIVLMPYLEFKHNERSERPNEMDLILAKQRNGPTGAITIHFNAACFLLTPLTQKLLNVQSTPPRPDYAQPDW